MVMEVGEMDTAVEEIQMMGRQWTVMKGRSGAEGCGNVKQT